MKVFVLSVSAKTFNKNVDTNFTVIFCVHHSVNIISNYRLQCRSSEFSIFQVRRMLCNSMSCHPLLPTSCRMQETTSKWRFVLCLVPIEFILMIFAVQIKEFLEHRCSIANVANLAAELIGKTPVMHTYQLCVQLAFLVSLEPAFAFYSSLY